MNCNEISITISYLICLLHITKYVLIASSLLWVTYRSIVPFHISHLWNESFVPISLTGSLQWQGNKHAIAPVPVKQQWSTWVNESHNSAKKKEMPGFRHLLYQLDLNQDIEWMGDSYFPEVWRTSSAQSHDLAIGSSGRCHWTRGKEILT